MPITQLANGTFEPEDIAVLQEMFDQLCSLRGIVLRQSPEAMAAAASLIVAYQSGLRGDELLQALASK